MTTWVSGYMQLNKVDWTLLCPLWLCRAREQRWPFKVKQRPRQTGPEVIPTLQKCYDDLAPPQKVKMPALFAEQEGISITQHLRHPKPGSSE